MSIAKLGAKVVDYNPKTFQVVKEGVQVTNFDSPNDAGFRTGIKIGKDVAYSMLDVFKLATGTTVEEIDLGNKAVGKAMDVIA